MRKKKMVFIGIGIILFFTLAALLVGRMKTLADLTYEGTGDYFSAPTVSVKVTKCSVTVESGNNFTYLGDEPLDVDYMDYAFSFQADGEYQPMLASASEGGVLFDFRLNPQDVIYINLGIDQSGPLGKIRPASAGWGGFISWLKAITSFSGEYVNYAEKISESTCMLTITLTLQDGTIITDEILMNKTNHLQR